LFNLKYILLNKYLELLKSEKYLMPEIENFYLACKLLQSERKIRNAMSIEYAQRLLDAARPLRFTRLLEGLTGGTLVLAREHHRLTSLPFKMNVKTAGG